jgi:hypothetical protein
MFNVFILFTFLKIYFNYQSKPYYLIIFLSLQMIGLAVLTLCLSQASFATECKSPQVQINKTVLISNHKKILDSLKNEACQCVHLKQS